MTAAGRLYRFQAVHSLPDFPPPWSRTHGHHYTVEVAGDFNHEAADALWDEMKSLYEYGDLNDVLVPTTVEALAHHFLGEFATVEGIRQVTVWEDDNRWGRAP